MRYENGTDSPGSGAIDHKDFGDVDSTVDAVGCSRTVFLIPATCRSQDSVREYGVRPGQPDSDEANFFDIPGSEASVSILKGVYIDQDGNSVLSGVVNGKTTTLNLVAVGDYAPIQYVAPDSELLDQALIDNDAAANPDEANQRYINEEYFTDDDGTRLVGYFDRQAGVAGEIFVSGEAGLVTVDLLGDAAANTIAGIDIDGRIEGIGIDTRIAQDIRFAHRLDVSNTNGGNGFFLSLQSEDIKYPNTLPDNIARAGYWLGLETPVDLGDLGTLPKNIYLSDIEYRQIEVGVERGLLQQTFVNLLDVALSSADIGNVDIGRDLLVTLSDLPLGSTQAPPVNCYGGVDCY